MATMTLTETNTEELAEAEPACVCGSRKLVNLGPCRMPGVSTGSDVEKLLSQQLGPGFLYRCCECHLGLRLPRPDDAAIAAIYESLPTTRWRPGTVAGSAQQYLIKRWKQAPARPLTVLDVGAFDGSFLCALPEQFEKAAIEPSDAAAALKDHGIRVLKSYLQPPTSAEAGQFDVVTMFDVFEHLADPIQGMQAAMAYVRPGGRLFVGTGNLDHWSWRQTRGTHWYLDPIQHVVVGSHRHFQWQAAALGVTSYRCRTFSHQPGTVRQRFLQSLTTLYFGARQRGGWRQLPVRLLNRFDIFRRMAHKPAMPYTQQLHDHLLAEFVRGEVTA
ncbi:MAG: class I SAM-dependent methyltransferase [Fuerstiella sp.]